jgi:hypothetical protein
VPNPDNPSEEQGGKFTLVQSKIVADPADPVEAVMQFCTIFTSVVSVSNTDPTAVVSLANEVYLRQNVLACYHCPGFDDEKIRSVTELLLRASPNPPVPLPVPISDVPFPDFEIAPDLALGIASLWEAIETAYLGRLHRAVLAHRVDLNLSARYLRTIRKQFINYLDRESNMQSTVNDFVHRYNEVPRPWDEESIGEMLQRVENLRDTIMEEVEERRREADITMKDIADRPWLGRQLVEKLQLVSAITQLELDRFVDSAAVLQDFCSASLGKVPPDATKSLRFEVPKVFGEDISDGWSDSLAQILLAEEFPEEEVLPEAFNAYLQSVLESAKTYITKMTAGVQTEIGKIENEFKPKPQKGKGKAPAKGKKGKGPTLDDVPSLEDLELQRITAKRMQLLQVFSQICKLLFSLNHKCNLGMA